MSQYFDENFESVLTMQASRPLGRRVAWLLGILLAVVLVVGGSMFLDDRTQKQRLKAATSAVTQPATIQPATGR